MNLLSCIRRQGGLFFFIFAICTLTASRPSLAKKQADFRILFSSEGISWIEAIDARTLMTPVFDEILAGRSESYSLDIAHSTSELIEKLKTNRFNTIIASQIEYLQISQHKKLIPMATDYRSGKSRFRLMLLVRKDAQIQDLTALRNKRLSLDKLDPIKNVYLSVLLARSKQKSPRSFFSAITIKKKEKSAVLDLFLGESEACLVKDVTFLAMAALNPQLKKMLAPIATSEEFVNGLLFTVPQMSKSKHKILKDAALNVHKRKTGKQAMSIFRITKMVPTKESDYDSARRLYAEYLDLQTAPQ